MPALLTSTSTVPNAARVASTAAAQLSSDVTSRCTDERAVAQLGGERARRRRRAGRRSTTRAPAACRARTNASPSPRAPPRDDRDASARASCRVMTTRTTRRPVVAPSASRCTAVGASSNATTSPTTGRIAPGVDQPRQLDVRGVDQLGPALRVERPVQAEHAVVLHQGVPGVDGLDRPAREADDDDPPLERDALGGLLERVAADGVEHDVGARARRSRPSPRRRRPASTGR